MEPKDLLKATLANNDGVAHGRSLSYKGAIQVGQEKVKPLTVTLHVFSSSSVLSPYVEFIISSARVRLRSPIKLQNTREWCRVRTPN